MRILALAIAMAALLFGFRMIFIAIRMAMSGKVLVRDGMRSRWQPAPTPQDAWKYALREIIMGLLFVILGVALLT